MTYAIVGCFDRATSSTLITVREALIDYYHLQHKPSDKYEPHVTLAIFDDLPTNEPLNTLSKAWNACSCRNVKFCGVGIFPTKGSILVHLNIIPTRELLGFHREVHRCFRKERRRDRYYDEGNWMPHVSLSELAMDKCSLRTIFEFIPSELIFHQADISKVEIVYTRDIDVEPPGVIESFYTSEASGRT